MSEGKSAATPQPEEYGRCPLCGSNKATVLLGKCADYQARREPAHIFHWESTSDEHRTKMRGVGSVAAPKAQPDLSERKYEALYAEARESLCSCNIVNPSDPVGSDYNYICQWCSEHPDGADAPPLILDYWKLEEENERLKKSIAAAPKNGSLSQERASLQRRAAELWSKLVTPGMKVIARKLSFADCVALDATIAEAMIDFLDSEREAGAPKAGEPPQADWLHETDPVKSGLKYIAASPEPEFGGFHPKTVEIAKNALQRIEELERGAGEPPAERWIPEDIESFWSEWRGSGEIWAEFGLSDPRSASIAKKFAIAWQSRASRASQFGTCVGGWDGHDVPHEQTNLCVHFRPLPPGAGSTTPGTKLPIHVCGQCGESNPLRFAPSQYRTGGYCRACVNFYKTNGHFPKHYKTALVSVANLGRCSTTMEMCIGEHDGTKPHERGNTCLRWEPIPGAGSTKEGK